MLLLGWFYIKQLMMERTALVSEEYSLCNNAIKTSFVVNHAQILMSAVV